MSSTVSKKMLKRPATFEEQLAAADRCEPVNKRPKPAQRKAEASPPIKKPEETSSSSCDDFHDPTCGRKQGHTFAYAGFASAGRLQNSGRSEDRLEHKPIHELEQLFSADAELRKTKDNVWKGLAEKSFSVKLEKEEKESHYGYYKRCKLAQEEKLAQVASRIEAKRQKVLADETKTARCAIVIPVQAKKRMIRTGMARAAIVPIPSPLEVVRARKEVANGNRAALNALPQNVKGLKKPDFVVGAKPKPKTTAPLMKKTLRMMRR